MLKLIEAPPHTHVELVTDIMHGVPVSDPYRWLEDQNSPRTHEWLASQAAYARSYLDRIPGRQHIRRRVGELLDVQTYDSIQKLGNQYVFRKRTTGQEQFCICRREGLHGEDELLLDPADRATGKYTSAKPLRISPNGRLLLYEIKQGGERTGTFEILDMPTRERLSDALPQGYLYGFAFAPHCDGFYYVHEPIGSQPQGSRVARHHLLGDRLENDREIFTVSGDDKLRLHLLQGHHSLGFLVIRYLDKAYTDLYHWSLDAERAPKLVIEHAGYELSPVLWRDDRIVALTDRDAPNYRIVEIRPREGIEPEFTDLVPTAESPIKSWATTEDCIFVAYLRSLRTEIHAFDESGTWLFQLPTDNCETVRLGAAEGKEIFVERESFATPIRTYCFSTSNRALTLWSETRVPFDSTNLQHREVWFQSRDHKPIPMFLVGQGETLNGCGNPTIMTSYGGYGVPVTPQFSVFVAFLLECGCLFALPRIRGGSEFGVEWHNAARRRNRQVAIDDFLAAAEWLIQTGRTDRKKLAIFGGSNAGLLVGAAMTQRPDLFRAVVCMVPILDMLRYHLFDHAHLWRDEYGTADDPEDFAALLSYSPYQNIREGQAYPATMFVSGDLDQNCNPMHARKMTARLQALAVADVPIILDYTPERGHSPVLPLSDRIDGLSDRLAFLWDQLELINEKEKPACR